ncbi:GNAT family N-acetyltransferase [Halobacillus rhizosphaerae]|uniref:GNAT family N-acetyltransferase n=1 Tax=Halobacillus rhizosphaerae TaxID=3064889 RepID=UPI00398B5A93
MNYLKETPWDKRTFGIDTFELLEEEETALEQTTDQCGHFTLKTNPLSDKRPLIKHGFYYTDTLLQPVCDKHDLQESDLKGTFISKQGELETVLRIARESFVHGRFHKDINIPNKLADLRYVRWVEDLYEQNRIFFLYYQDETMGFIGCKDEQILLMGVDKKFRSKGLSRPVLIQVCKQLVEDGHDRLTTSISAVNLPSLNLFLSIGFKLRGVEEVYHKLNGSLTAVE